MKKTFEKLILFIPFSLIIISCSKDKDNCNLGCSLNSYSDCRLETIDKIDNISSLNYHFYYNNSNIVEKIKTTFIANQDTTITNYVFHYSEGKLTGFTTYMHDNEFVDTTIDGSVTYDDGLIQKVNFRPDYNRCYEFQYDNNGKVIKVSNVNNGKIINSSTFTYNNNFNISEEIYYNGTSTLFKYEDYDNKKNPYRAINLPDAIIYSFGIGWPFSQNNFLSETYVYQYNLNDFPEIQEFTCGYKIYFTYDCIKKIISNT